MSQSKPPSPVHPNSESNMAETQRPPTFPVVSFLGHPDRYHTNTHGYTPQVPHVPLSTTPSRPSQSHGYPILPPLRLQLGSSAPTSHAPQAVPISKLLSDSPPVPARMGPPTMPPYSPVAASSPPHYMVVTQPVYHTGSEVHLPPLAARVSQVCQPHSPSFGQGYPVSSSKVIHSPHFVSRSPSSISAGSVYSPRHSTSAVSEKKERATPYNSPSPDVRYSLNMRQQPIAARACGFGERDRRVVDPPPIVEVTLMDQDTGLDEEDAPNVYTTLHCTVVHADNLLDASQIEQSRSDMAMTQRLMGTCVASPFPGKDEHGNKGTFFVFPDLSCRSPGRYRFLFRLIVVDPVHLVSGGTTKIQTQIYSEPFEVYSAKEFPGMRASSALLKTLRKQGLNVAVKKGREATKKSNRKTHADGEDSDEDEEMAEDDEDEDDQGIERGQDKKKRKRSG